MRTSQKQLAHISSLLLILLALLTAFLPRAEAQDIYWTVNGPTIMGADLDGSNVVEVFDGTGMAGIAVDVAVTATHVYWTDKNDTSPNGGVWRANRDGSEAALFISNPDPSTITTWAPQFIVIDQSNDRLYFTDYYTGLYSARLSDGGDVIALGGSGGQFAGLTQLSGTELIYGNGAGADTSFYLLDLTTKSSSAWRSGSGDGQNYGLAYDADRGLLYYTSFGDGAIRSLDPNFWTDQDVLTGLSGALGLTLSASGSHLLYVERNSDRISAYDIANPENSFELLSGKGAFFGVAIWGDPQPPPPTPPADLPVVETFDAGTPGGSIVDQLTSDGKAVWRQQAKAGDATLTYEGEPGAVTFEPFTGNGSASIFLELDVDGTEHYRIRFDDVLLRGGRGDINGSAALSSFVAIGARKTDGSALGTYRIGQWHQIVDNGANYQFLYGIHYVDVEGNTQIAPGNWTAQKVPVAEVDAGDYSGSELLRSGLTIQVRGSEQRLFLNGAALGPWYPTQGSYGDGSPEQALVIQTNAADHAATFVNPVFNGLRIDAPPPAIAGWQEVDDFNDRNLGPIHEQGLWSTLTNHADVIENPYGAGRVLRISGGRASHLIQIPEGETGTVFFRARPFGNDDFSFGTSRSLDTNLSASAGQFAFRASGRLDIVDNSASPNHIKPLDVYEPHTWYDVWIVINNETNTAKYYVRGGEFTEQTLLNDDSGTTEFNHRSPEVGDILSFGFQGFHNGFMLLDQVWVNALEPDLTDPSPTPQDVEPVTHAGPLLAYEGFNYAPGPVVGQAGGTGWIYGHMVYGSDISPTVVEPGATWNDLQVSGNRLVADNPGSTTGAVSFRWVDTNAIDPALIDQWGQVGSVGSTYVSVIAKGGDPTENRFWGFGMFRGNQERIFLGKGTGETVGWHFREQSAPALNRVITSLSLTDQHFMVIKLDQDAGKVYLFANPDLSAGEPAVESAEAVLNLTSTIGNWGFNNVRVTGAETGITIDEIRIGTTWESVTPTGVVTPSGFAAWQEQHFGGQTDPSIIGPDADADGDGIPNLLEYAFGADPVIASREGLPTHGVEEIGGEQYLTVTITRPIGLSDISYEVNESDDLRTWSNTAVPVGSPTDNGDGTETITYRSSGPISSVPAFFLEVRVDRIEMS